MSMPSRHTQHRLADDKTAVSLQSTRQEEPEKQATSLGYSTEQDENQNQTSPPPTIQESADKTIDAFMNPTAKERESDERAMSPSNISRASANAFSEGGVIAYKATDFRPLPYTQTTSKTG